MKRNVVIVALLALTLSCAGACGKKDAADTKVSQSAPVNSADLVGTWKGTGDEISTLTLGSDGSYKDDAGDLYMVGTYKVDSAAGTLTVNESEYGMVFTYSVELSGNDLTLQLDGGLPRTFTKK